MLQKNLSQYHSQSLSLSHSSVEPTQRPKSPDEQTLLIQELTTSRYVSTERIGDYMSYVRSIYSWKTPFFQLDFWIPDDQVSEWNYQLNKLLRRLETLRKYYDSSKPIHFVCMPLDIPRHFPANKQQCLGREHVNGGYTYVNGHTVYLFREEELSKVMIHEYLHQIQGHKDVEWTPEALDEIRRLVPIPEGIDFRPNEAVIEAWALFYHTQFLSIETGIPFKRLWEAEKQFVLQQARQIWAHQSQCLPRWNEQTHTFSYYILKACFIWAWKKNDLVWRLDYSIPELVDWTKSHWDAWKNMIDTGRKNIPRPDKKIPLPIKSARMTLLGDY